MNRSEVFYHYQETFNQEGWRYDVRQDQNGNDYIQMGFNIRSTMSSTTIRVIFRDRFVLVYAYSPLKVDQNQRSRVARYLCLANFGLKAGDFEMDFNDGEVRYKVFLETAYLDDLPSGLITHSVRVCLGMMERYGDGLAALTLGYSDPDTEIAKAESD